MQLLEKIKDCSCQDRQRRRIAWLLDKWQQNEANNLFLPKHQINNLQVTRASLFCQFPFFISLDNPNGSIFYLF